ncbi:MAG: SagB/ThcOx family dehydrogenase [Bacteroidales bacterium]
MKSLILFLLLYPIIACGQKTGDIQLPKPNIKGGKPLMDALMERHSSREFAAEKLEPQTLSDLLWAANGYNRADQKKRTAASSMNYQEIDIYLAMEEGLYLWDAEKNTLMLAESKDLREVTGKQAFVKDAPLNLIYVADFTKTKDGKTDAQVRASYANTGLIAQNVYLFCASAGLNVIIRGYFDAAELSKQMNLKETQLVIYCQTVGKPLPE